MSKSSSLISSSSDSEMGKEEGKNQQKQFQSSKLTKKSSEERTHKKKKKYDSRSRSPSSSLERSRSNKKQRHDLKKKHRRSRSRSRSHKKHKSSRHDKYDDRRVDRDYRRANGRDRDRRNSKERRDDRDRREYRDKYRGDRAQDRHDRDRNIPRGRQRQRDRPRQTKKQQIPPINTPLQVPMPLQVAMPAMPGERRKRQRSNSPLSYYRRNAANNEGEFWDSFSWQPRMNYTPNVSSSALSNTKKMRRLLITNIPYEMGITKDDLKELITRFMAANYLNDNMNSCPVREVEPNQEDHNVAVELSSVEETCRMTKLEKIELFKGAVNGVVRLGDSCYGNNVITQAQHAAQAQAGVFAAINVLENKKTAFNMEAKIQAGESISTLLRVTNAVTPYMAQHLNKVEWEEFNEDLLEGFSQYGNIVHSWFVKHEEKDVCADPGNLFVEFEAYEQAAKAMDEMQGRIYDERLVKIFYVNRDIYYTNYKKGITVPTIKPPPKGMKIQKLMTELPNISKSSHIASSSNGRSN